MTVVQAVSPDATKPSASLVEVLTLRLVGVDHLRGYLACWERERLMAEQPGEHHARHRDAEASSTV